MTLPPVYPILDLATLERRGVGPVEATEALLEGGARILQWRDKRPPTRRTFELARRVAELCRQASASWIVNDRADLALMLDAGVHLGQDDLSVEAARQVLGERPLIGFSTHNRAQFAAADREPADYLAVGPIFGTASKENPDPALGVEVLRELRPLSAKPMVAIGGITHENAASVFAAGVDSVAVVGDLYPEPCTRQAIRNRMEEWQRLSSH